MSQLSPASFFPIFVLHPPIAAAKQSKKICPYPCSHVPVSNNNRMEYETDGYLEPLKTESSGVLNVRRSRTATSSRSPTTPSGSERSGDSNQLPFLHGSLMRSRTEKDPHRYYEVIKVLGEGSMGSVSKVQKRKSVVGGSARSYYVEEEKRRSRWWCPGVRIPCFIFCPVLSVEKSKNSLLQTIEEHCPASETLLPPPTTMVLSESSHGSSSSSIITYGRKDVIYALKSIHIDRVKDAVYRKELMNEIAILQTLDHPNIVKAIVG
jgi:hypothetical protein